MKQKRLVAVATLGLVVAACGLRGNPPVPHAAPSVADLRVEGRDGAVRISWKGDPPADLKAFDVLRRLDDPAHRTYYERIGLLRPAGAKRYYWVDDKLESGHTYWYRVRPRLAGDVIPEKMAYEGPEESIAWTTPPPAPSEISGTALHFAARLVWNRIDGATGYRVYVSDSAGNAALEPALRGLVESTSWTPVALPEGKRLCWTVRAVIGTPPAVLRGPEATPTPEPASPAGAEINASATSGIPIPRENVPAAFRRAGAQLLGEGGLSGIESKGSPPVCVTPGATEPPPPPKLLHAAVVADGITLSWRPSTGEQVTGYLVERRAIGIDGKPTEPFRRLNPDLIPGTTYTDRDVSKGSSYEYQVRAVDASGTLGDPTPARPATFSP